MLYYLLKTSENYCRYCKDGAHECCVSGNAQSHKIMPSARVIQITQRLLGPLARQALTGMLDYHFGEVQQDQVDGVAYETEELVNLMPDDVVIEATEGAQVA